MADDDSQFESADSGASQTFPQQCSSLRKNGYVVLRHRPCKIVEMSTSKTGKHGHAKVHLVGLDLFSMKKYEDVCPSTHNVEVPFVSRIDFDVIGIDDEGFLSLMLPENESSTRDDLKIPDGDLGKEIKDKFESEGSLQVTVLKAMGQEMVIGWKNI